MELVLPVIVKKTAVMLNTVTIRLASSTKLALRKRPVSSNSVDASITQIEEKLLSLGEKEIPSERVGELVLHELKCLDQVAYIRFTSIYKKLCRY